jgi:uncharacterized protein YjiS (DUF1127 family)
MATQVLRGTRGTGAAVRHAPEWKDAVASFIKSVRIRVRKARTRRQLRLLTDRELADIGLTRAKIERALRGSFPFV